MKLSNKNILSIAIGLVGIVWCVAIFVVADICLSSGDTVRYFGALLFGIQAVVIAILYLQLIHKSPGNQAVEVGAVSLYYTIGYVAAALVLNAVLVVCRLGGFNRYSLLLNLAILVIYIILILFAEKDTQRVARQLNHMQQRTSPSRNISQQLTIILSLVEDPELRKRLLKLQESVTYSSNISQNNTLPYENAMMNQLEDLKNMIISQKSSDVILSKLREAEVTWKTRSSIVSSRG